MAILTVPSAEAPPATTPDTQPATPPDTQPATPPANSPWHDVLPENLRQDPNILKYKSMEDFAAGHINLVTKLGTRAEDPPETPDGYTWKPTAEMQADEELLKAARTHLHGLKLPDSQASKVLEFMTKAAAEAVKAQATATQSQVESEYTQALADLKAEWGPQYETRVAAASNVLGKFPELKALCIQESLEDSPAFARVLDMLARQTAAPGAPPPPSGGASSPTAPAAWQSQVESLKASKAYSDPGHPDHPAVRQQLIALYEQRYK